MVTYISDRQVAPDCLLTKLGMMQFDHALAGTSFAIATLLMVAAMLWGSCILWKGFQVRNRS